LDLPRKFVIRESSHRIHNPFTAEKLATLGAAIGLRPGQSVLDLCSGSGEMLATWARDHGITGVGVDISTVFVKLSAQRAEELGVADRVSFLHGDAATHVSPTPVDVAACIGATWIGHGVPGTIAHLERSLRPGGMLLVGEPFWHDEPPAAAFEAGEFTSLAGTLDLIESAGAELVELVGASTDDWDRFEAAQWDALTDWLTAHPGDARSDQVRGFRDHARRRYVGYRRRYLGWAVFVLRP